MFESIENTIKESVADEQRAYIQGQLQLASTVAAIVAALYFFFLYGSFTHVGILYTFGGMTGTVLLVQASRILTQQRKLDTAEKLFPISILVALISIAIGIDGLENLIFITGIFAYTFEYLILRSTFRKFWIGHGIAFIALSLTAFQLPFDRFDSNLADNIGVFLTVFVGIFALMLFWQIILRWQESPIRYRMLFAFIMIGAIPTAISSIASDILSTRSNEAQVGQFLSATITSKEENINFWLLNNTNSMRNALQQPTVISSLNLILLQIAPNPTTVAYQEIYESFRLSVSQNVDIESLSLLNLSGRVILSTDQDFLDQNFSQESFFRQGLNRISNSSLQYNPANNQPFFYISVPVLDSTGDVRGVMIGEINPAELLDIVVERSALGETGDVYLISSDNILLTNTRSTGFIPGQSPINSTGIDFAINQGVNVDYSNYENYAGVPVVGAYKWLENINAAIVVEQNQSEAYELLRLNQGINIGITIFTLGIAFISALLITRSIALPIAQLAEQATAFAANQRDDIEPIDRNDEVGELSKVLNQVGRQLRDTLSNLESLVEARTIDLENRATYLEAAAEVGQAATQIYDTNKLLNTVTHQISEKFKFYHVGIFLIDNVKEYAVLRAANSEGGYRMLARGHKLRVGEQGIVGYVTGTGQPRIQQSVGQDGVYYDNPDLPQTRSEMALPLKVVGEVVGALDVQSTAENAFGEEDIAVLQVLADQVAMAINNARLFSRLQEQLQRERRAFGDINRQAWNELLHRRQIGYRSDNRITQAIDGHQSPYSAAAIEQGERVGGDTTTDGKAYPLSIPIKTRGNIVVAVIDTHKPVEQGPWSISEIETLESIGEQIGIALENARLFEETQRLAQRERITADVSGKVWSSSNIDTILQTAIQELAQALNASEGAIRLRLPDEEVDQ